MIQDDIFQSSEFIALLLDLKKHFCFFVRMNMRRKMAFHYEISPSYFLICASLEFVPGVYHAYSWWLAIWMYSSKPGMVLGALYYNLLETVRYMTFSFVENEPFLHKLVVKVHKFLVNITKNLCRSDAILQKKLCVCVWGGIAWSNSNHITMMCLFHPNWT